MLVLRKSHYITWLLAVIVAGCGAQVTTQTVGEVLPPKGKATSEADAPMVSGGGILPDAAYFRGTDGVPLLRQYFLRANEPLPKIEALRLGALGQGRTALHDLTAKYGWEQDGFKKRELAAAFDAEAPRLLKTGEKHRALAIWHSVSFQPYNFENRTHTFCLRVSLTGCLQPGKSLQLGTEAYPLTVEAPSTLSIATDEAVARALEKSAAMESYRGMRVLLVIELQDSASGHQLKGRLRGVHIYQRESHADIMDVPDEQRRLVSLVLPEQSPAAMPRPVPLPTVVLAPSGNPASANMAPVTVTPSKPTVFPVGLKWKVMHYASFNFKSDAGPVDPNIKAGAYALWKPQLDALKDDAVSRKKEPAPAFVLVSAPFRENFLFSMINLPFQTCIPPGNGAGMVDMYSICQMSVFKVDPAPVKIKEISNMCFLHLNDTDHPVARYHSEFAFDEAQGLAYFRIIQHGKVVPECNRSLRLQDL